MQTRTWGAWALYGTAEGTLAALVDKGASAFAALVLAGMVLQAIASDSAMAPSDPVVHTASAARDPASPQDKAGREILIAGYAGGPLYHRSDVHMVRPDGTDLTLKQLGWDGDMLYFPIDGGIRSVEWWGPAGFMVDFTHNKAVPRLGKGAHGRKLAHPVVEEVEAEGTLAGQPISPRVKLTDVFERFEFTHGHNTLLFTGLVRPLSLTSRIRPYFGIGFGFALPHVEAWFPGGARDDRTSEYQYAGPAAQAIAGLELRTGKASYFLEYKFIWAHLMGALTGDESWLDFMMPDDLRRQFMRWWRGEEPKFGRFETTLFLHEIVGGAGYWWQARRPAP
jgi:hypothetical protein